MIEVSRRRAWYILAVIIVTTFAASINRQVLFLLVEPLKLEMSLSDADIGILMGLAPGVVAGAGALLLGWLTDRIPRHVLLGACILIWSAATAFLGSAVTFVGFLAGVLALALGETSVTPVANSLMPDIFAGRRRITANLIYFAAGGIALGMGSAASGILLSWVQENSALLPSVLASMAYWRITFLIVAMAGIPVALLAFSIGNVLRRSAYEATNVGDKASLKEYAREHGRAAAELYLAIAMTSFAGLAVMSWTPAYVIRVFDVTPSEAGWSLGVAATVGGLCGVVIAALLVKCMFVRYGALAPRHLFKYSMLLTMLPALLQLVTTTVTHAYVLYGAQIAFANIGIALSSTMIQNISPARYRGRLFGVSVLLITLVSSLAPYAVGSISDQLSTEPQGLLWAILLVAVPALGLSAIAIDVTNERYEKTASYFAVN